MTTAVLEQSATGPRSGRRLAGLIPDSPALLRALPTTALVAATTVLFAAGVLPVVDGELIGAGLVLGFLATGLARLVDRSTAAGDGALIVQCPSLRFGRGSLP